MKEVVCKKVWHLLQDHCVKAKWRTQGGSGESGRKKVIPKCYWVVTYSEGREVSPGSQ